MAGKRSNGEGTMRLRSDGRWELTVMIGYKPDGKRNYKSFRNMLPGASVGKSIPPIQSPG